MMDTRVMLVDDDEMIRDSVELFFQAKGVSILAVASGEECLDYLHEGFRGIILMDVIMPVMNGWDTIRKIVEDDLYDGNIIVMLTGLESPDSSMNGIQEYVADYLRKPFNPEELVDILSYYSALLDNLEPVDG